MQVQVIRKNGQLDRRNPSYLLELKQDRECYNNANGSCNNPCIGCVRDNDDRWLDYCHYECKR